MRGECRVSHFNHGNQCPPSAERRSAGGLNARCWLRKAYSKVRRGGSFNVTTIRNSFRLPGIFLSGFRGFYLFAKSTGLFFRTIANLVLSGKMFRLKCGRLISFLFSGWKDGSVPCFEFELVWKMRLREHWICWFVLIKKKNEKHVQPFCYWWEKNKEYSK